MENKPYKNKCRNRIRELRIARGHNSLRGFAEFINTHLGYEVSASALSQLELHRRENPYWELVDVLSTYFGVTADYLMGKTDYNVRKEEVIKDREDKVTKSPEEELLMQQFYDKMREMYAEKEKAKEERRALKEDN
ncbi:helix-turn-helix domain-containing protein [Selenomonas ruminantium]|uniref:Uncharacterized protein n=1 Tax=Selenomonas ruminantium TaxID=971 RepID=A0A1I0YDM1_SELRU|nr:helix-turn-helix transcriptional regulator [Selenomonas ruminantium]SFB10610.1 hypothetical protein SAMN05216587_11182 [Selenomonas ruminantium]